MVDTLSSICSVHVHRLHDLDLLCQAVTLFLQQGSTSFSPPLVFPPYSFLTFLSPIWLTFCLHLFRCSQQQWPSSRLVRPRCQVSFFILPAVHSILQLSSLRSRGGKSAARRRKRERGGGREKQNYCAPCRQLKWISFQAH